MDILNWPGVAEQNTVDQSLLLEIVKSSFQKTVEALIENRQIEGERLRGLIIKRLDELTRLVKDVRSRRLHRYCWLWVRKLWLELRN